MLERLLTAFIKKGRLAVILANGKVIRTGDPSDEASADVVVRLRHARTALKIALRPTLYFGEAYMDGSLSVEKGNLWDLLDLCGKNLAHRRSRLPIWFGRTCRTVARYFQQYNSRRAARRNVAHHYDLSERLFRSFLDTDLQYSCAYFRDPTLSLDQAQAAKKRHIVAKLLLAPGQRVLDVGCGWGGLAIAMAKDYPVHVTAVTLSQDQLRVAKQRAAEARIDERIAFDLRDYREIEGRFDRVVSVGMFEHVGRPNYETFFDKVATLLADDGVALIHAIGRMDGPGLTDAWTRKYIFPGGYIPALSEVLPAVERAGLWATDIEILRLHYAETLRAWREQFLAGWTSTSKGADDQFRRMWEFYLAGSEMAFRYGGLMVFQLQLAKRVDALPLTRDYMFAQERA
ncbi:MAG: class I SAM-dependent methyltransferase [Gemmataceae bacterium]